MGVLYCLWHQDTGGQTALHKASRALLVRVVARLLKEAPDLANVQSYPSRSPGGYTPLHGMACLPRPKEDRPERHDQICKMLIDAMSVDCR